MEIVSPLSEFPLTPPNSPTSEPYANLTPPKIDLLLAQQQLKTEQGSWTVPDQLVLQQKITQCSIRKEAHWDTARNCSKKAKLLTIPKLILSTILASTLTLLTQEEENKILEYFTTSTSIIVALLTTISAFLNYDVEKTKHRSSSLNYSKLAAYIDRVLRLPADERNSFGETLAKVNEQYAEIRRDAPFIKPYIIKNYIHTFTKQEQPVNIIQQNKPSISLEMRENKNENFTRHLVSLDRKMANIQMNFFAKEEQTELNTAKIKSDLDTILSHLIGPLSDDPHIEVNTSPVSRVPKMTDNLDMTEESAKKTKYALEATILADLIGPISDNTRIGKYRSLSSGLSNISETDASNNP